MRDPHTTAEVFEAIEDEDTQYIPLEGIAAEETSTLFPVYALPEPFKSFVDAGREALNYPEDYTGTALIAAVSTAIGNTARIQVKKGWVQPAIIYAGLMGPPSVVKSHPLNKVFEVFEDEDARERKRYVDDLKRYKNELQTFSKSKQAAPPLEPTPLQTTVLTQGTQESIVKHLQGNKRGCCVHSDELVTFFEAMLGYSKAQNLSLLLEAWGGRTITQHRVEDSRFVEAPFMNIVGCIQPRMLREVFSAKNVNSGLLQRFLWAYPERCEKRPINKSVIEDRHLDTQKRWFREFREVHRLRFEPETNKVSPTLYEFSAEAFDYYQVVQTQNTELVNSYGDTTEAEVLGKFDDHLARLALVLHFMIEAVPGGRPVSLQAMQASATLCEYYANTALRVVNLLNGGGPVLTEVEANFLSSLPETFTTAEALRAGVGLGQSERTVYNWLDHPKFRGVFLKTQHGTYRKVGL